MEHNGNRKQEGPNMGIMKHEGETRAWRAHGEQNNNKTYLGHDITPPSRRRGLAPHNIEGWEGRQFGGPSGHAWTGRDASKAVSNPGPMVEQAAPGAMAKQGS